MSKEKRKETEKEKEIREMAKAIKEINKKQHAFCAGCEKRCENIDRYKFAATSLVEAGFCNEIHLLKKAIDDFNRYLEEKEARAEKRVQEAPTPDDAEWYEGEAHGLDRLKFNFNSVLNDFYEDEEYYSTHSKRDTEDKENDILDMTKIIYHVFNNITLFCGDFRKLETFDDCKDLAETLVRSGFGKADHLLSIFFEKTKKVIEEASSYGTDFDDNKDDDYYDDDYICGHIEASRDIIRDVKETEKKLAKKPVSEILKRESIISDSCDCKTFVESEEILKAIRELGYRKEIDVVEKVCLELLQISADRGGYDTIRDRDIKKLRNRYKKEDEND